MSLDDFDYELPKELIAQSPAIPRSSSRLMVVHNNKIEHKHFYDILDYLKEGDTLVINESKVKPAKLVGKKMTGARAELILERRAGKETLTYLARIKTQKPRIGTELVFDNGLSASIIDKETDTFKIKFNKKIPRKLLILPTPPYIKQKVRNKDYQTVFAKIEGSLAAPTAGLHFSSELLKKIKAKGVNIAKVCLHISFGTFLPIRDNEISKHKMDSEYFSIDKKNADIINSTKGRLIAVGTTSLKALESAHYKNGNILPCKGLSNLFIYPGYKFKSKTSALITNFHLPKSTLLLLVSAFYGRESILNAYHEAVKHKYRFFSLGDAMLLVK